MSEERCAAFKGNSKISAHDSTINRVFSEFRKRRQALITKMRNWYLLLSLHPFIVASPLRIPFLQTKQP